MTPARIRLHDLAKGKAEAMVGLREYQDVAEAAKKVVWFDWSDNDSDAVSDMDKLREALRKGGFLE